MADRTPATFRFHRRDLLLATAAILASPALALSKDDRPIATTRSGRIAGRDVDGVKVFKGIPYGLDTGGTRFMPPRRVPAWSGVRDAFDFGYRAPQQGAERPKLYDSWANPQPENENCLVLNVYTPGLHDGKKRPIMVWFHGGGFSSGSAASRYADGTRLASRQDVVVVTVNHRLNAFGYLYLADLGGPDLADSGNVGNLDLALALEWVRDNAAACGGDPSNVTIFGQSGGGQKVTTLMAMPSAVGLFHKAIVQSGPLLRALEPEEAKAETRKVLAALNLPLTEIGRLRTIPTAELSAAVIRSGARFQPVVDGRSLPRHPFDPDAPAISKAVPLMIGTARTETASLAGGSDETLFQLTWDDLPRRLEREPILAGYDRAQLIAGLRGQNPKAEPSEVYFIATTAALFRVRSRSEADRKFAQGGAPVFMYLMTWETPIDGGRYHSPHSVEHGFVFDNVAVSASMLGTGADLQGVADAMSGAWTRFARTGNPGWAPYTPSDRTTMVFNTDSKAVSDPLREERLLFATAGKT